MREKEKAREGGKAGRRTFDAIIKLINLFHLYIIKK